MNVRWSEVVHCMLLIHYCKASSDKGKQFNKAFIQKLVFYSREY